MASSGFGAGATSSSSAAEDMVASGEVWKSGGRKCEDDGVGWRRGVEVCELSVDGGRRTRLARRKVKNAVRSIVSFYSAGAVARKCRSCVCRG